jgi:hypothetical protein
LISNYAIGLDISTSCTGVALITEDGELIDLLTHVPKGSTLVEKTAHFREFLVSEISGKYANGPNFIFIEQNLQRFRRGFSSAQVINTLARYNGMSSFVAYEMFGKQPIYINVNEARKVLEIKIKRGENSKEKVLEWAKNTVNFSWPTKILKSGPRRGLEILDPKCYDMADALVTATAGLRMKNDTRRESS